MVTLPDFFKDFMASGFIFTSKFKTIRECMAIQAVT